MTPDEKARFAESQVSKLVETLKESSNKIAMDALIADLVYWWGELRKWNQTLERVGEWRERGLI